MYNLWNSGFECAWKCEKVMRRQYFFWILNKCSNWPVFRGAAQTILQYAMYGSTRAKYKTRVWVSGRIWRTFAIIPTFLADLLRTTSMCLLQPRSDDIITPRNFASNCCSILVFIHIYTSTSTSTSMHVHVYVHVHVHVHIYTSTSMHVHVYVHVHVYIYVYVYTRLMP